MTERIPLALTTHEVDALIKALKHCGVEDNSTQKLFSIFHDYDLVNASKGLLKRLSSAERFGASRAQAGEKSDILRAISPSTPLDALKKENAKLKVDLQNLYSAHRQIVETVQRAVDTLGSDSANAVRSQLATCLHNTRMAELEEDHPFL